MILLDISNYDKVLEPLKKVRINHLFADAVLRGHVSGQVYVDNDQKPGVFYVVHPYGMSLLFGENIHEEFNSWMLGRALNNTQTRVKDEWLQAYPETWNNHITSAWTEYIVKPDEHNNPEMDKRIEVYTRVNFKFNKATYLDFKNKELLSAIKTVRTTAVMFENIQGSVIPGRFWDNVDDFSQRAVSFSVLEGDQVVATAFSAFIIDDLLEIGIETSDSHRGKGYALAACSALIDYCIENHMEPVWGCKLENTASYLLAQKLGFQPTVYWPFYRLS